MNNKNIKGAIGGIPEQVIAMAVAILAVAGMIVLGYQAFQTAKITSAVSEFSRLSEGIKNLYMGQWNYADIDNQKLIKADVVPDTMINGTTIMSPWGKEVIITAAPNASGVADNSAVKISYTGLTSRICTDFASELQDKMMSNEIEGIQRIDISAIQILAQDNKSKIVSACNSSSNTVGIVIK